MEQEQLIQHYVAQKLSKIEMEEVAHKMKVDATFKAAVDEYKLIASSIKISEKDKLKKRLQAIENERTPKKNPFKIWQIAATIAVLIGIGSFYVFQNSNNAQSLYASNFEPYPNTLQPVVRDIPGNLAFMEYENGNYEKAISEFQKMLELQDNPDIKFYLAMSHLNTGATDKALIILKSIEDTNTRYLPQTHWYSALAHLKSEDKKSALQSLKKLKTVDAMYKKDKRTSLENQLN
ncbi:hypothetical protein ULMS_07010 [Patiriisocius marinistellae]|uniref:Uncharacterized protein n=1 Tax=Patiriisocius marinistellae TaxID=2494560 RepID=A0A5J4FU01_9FLAO|nr:tetratricopeptide repeat protein [Patiriisocius marinistellae]GEQ85193.1 hypothetical protein ULMS_07010 [Patiriisocius marinistellae]